ncbi:C4-dicarboxylate TRAP transporter substrate-binding protein [Mycobacterium sp. GA-2829]|uniref:C4-dicarboxylate TRAP transporter substrate-binding protein n=1 Tax=Mycobacterium sp. GA-2829 TaxID=1772283 RepID=UPI0007402D46|nr:C4-dicarboxylate TRAP transporter substrate-binding protein [Mycobacterium sp. GA-2829]KUI35541.1 ABC transporter substrate-binding protein [Mycobacterium sp. GA-2829]
MSPVRIVRRLRRAAAVVTAVASAAALSSCAVQDGKYVLHYTTYSSPTSDQSITMQRWADEVEERTGGGVTITFHYSESLVGADESLQATLDGRADLAQVGSLYSASDLSMFTVIELPFETNNPQVQMTAIERLYEENETYRDDFDRQGVQLLFPLPLGINLIGLKEPAATPKDLAGRSIRSGGLTSEALLAVGANPVSMTATDVYESMERGVIDGYTSLAIANLPTFGLSTNTPYLVDPGIGAYASSIVVINSELFEKMPPEYQDAIGEASGRAIANGLEEMDELGARACTDLRSTGTQLATMPAADVAAWKDRAGIAQDWVDRYAERGYDAQGVLDDYRRIIREESARSRYADQFYACLEGEGR